MLRTRPPAALGLAGLLFVAPLGAVAADHADPAAVVKAFNAALGARQLEQATGMFANGAVVFTLRASHSGMTAVPAGVTADLKTHWNTVAPVLYSVTTTYERVPAITKTHVDGEIATVWADIATKTVEKSGQTRGEKFSELYVLAHQKDGWKIVAIGDNRRPNPLAAAR